MQARLCCSVTAFAVNRCKKDVKGSFFSFLYQICDVLVQYQAHKMSHLKCTFRIWETWKVVVAIFAKYVQIFPSLYVGNSNALASDGAMLIKLLAASQQRACIRLKVCTQHEQIPHLNPQRSLWGALKGSSLPRKQHENRQLCRT